MKMPTSSPNTINPSPYSNGPLPILTPYGRSVVDNKRWVEPPIMTTFDNAYQLAQKWMNEGNDPTDYRALIKHLVSIGAISVNTSRIEDIHNFIKRAG